MSAINTKHSVLSSQAYVKVSQVLAVVYDSTSLTDSVGSICHTCQHHHIIILYRKVHACILCKIIKTSCKFFKAIVIWSYHTLHTLHKTLMTYAVL